MMCGYLVKDHHKCILFVQLTGQQEKETGKAGVITVKVVKLSGKGSSQVHITGKEQTPKYSKQL